MKDRSEKSEKKTEEKREMVEEYYKKVMRIIEYYVLLCFILITFVPLLEFSWVQGFTSFIYMTGFPLLIMLFLISLVKDPLLNFITKLIKK